ncbi:hypothetical protein [Pseudorhodoferax sp.]|uniref:hypothetical protein n=1 Tax=Pseudorhodoferax sp. TaxID=1993553 RepID=UPI002DD6B633|nr:hypothetical protein [Pseudorhodoferax sp.]
MSNTELAARVLIQRYLRHRKIPRLMRDAAVVAVQSRLQAGTLPCPTDGVRSGIDNRSGPASAAPGPTADSAYDTAAPATDTDVRALSDADLIDRFKVVCALEQALHMPCAEAGVHAAIAKAARHNGAEMLDIVDDLVRRIVQRGQTALR